MAERIVWYDIDSRVLSKAYARFCDAKKRERHSGCLMGLESEVLEGCKHFPKGHGMEWSALLNGQGRLSEHDLLVICERLGVEVGELVIRRSGLRELA
jgi:hypothetical protein